MLSMRLSVFIVFLANIAPILNTLGNTSNRVQSSIPLMQILTSRVLIEILFYFLVLLLVSLFQVLVSQRIFVSSFGKDNTEKFRSQGTFLIALLITLTFYFSNFLFLGNSSSALPNILLAGIGGFVAISISGLLLISLWRRQFFNLGLLIVVAIVLVLPKNTNLIAVSPKAQPNIFVFGVDGLRPDVLQNYKIFAPSIADFVSESMQFNNAFTPLARTHASLTALLTSQYPMKSGVNFNLIDSSLVKMDLILPDILRRHGYQTFLGLNERRFSNIDENYGFQTVVGPKAGMSDFLMSGLSDIPVVNILSQFEFSKYVFPYVRSNRALLHSYQPEHFTSDIKSHLNASSSVSPVFSLIHFTEPHYPYWPVDKNNDALMNMTEESGNFRRYLQAVQVVDRSFNQLMSELNESGYLDNAVVILLSDHGESFEQDQWRFSGAQDSTHIERGYGHGTTVAALEQSHIVLAMQQYKDGVSITEPKVISDLVSVVDVYPTLLSIAGYDIPAGIDGVNLLTIENRSENIGLKEKRTIPIETGFYAPALMNDVLNEWEVFMESFNAFEISTVGRVVLKREKALELIPSKELAVFDGDNMLVFPREHKGQFAPPILYNTKELTYRVASKEEDGEIVSAFCGYYWNQYLRTDVDNWCSDRTTR